MGCTDNDLCLVAVLAAYMTIRGSNNGPFFMLKNRTPLTREQFVEMTKEKKQQQESVPVVTPDTVLGLGLPQQHQHVG